MKTTVIVTIHLGTSGDARPTLELIENDTFSNNQEIIDYLESNGVDRQYVEIATLSDFMDSYNNDELNQTETFMGYAQIENLDTQSLYR